MPDNVHQTDEETMTVKELSERTGTPLRTVFNWVEAMRLPLHSTGKKGSRSTASRILKRDAVALFRKEAQRARYRADDWERRLRLLEGQNA